MSIVLAMGGGMRHVTVKDQGGNPLDPNEVTVYYNGVLPERVTWAVAGSGINLAAANPGNCMLLFVFGSATMLVPIQVDPAVDSLILESGWVISELEKKDAEAPPPTLTGAMQVDPEIMRQREMARLTSLPPEQGA